MDKNKKQTNKQKTDICALYIKKLCCFLYNLRVVCMEVKGQTGLKFLFIILPACLVIPGEEKIRETTNQFGLALASQRVVECCHGF